MIGEVPEVALTAAVSGRKVELRQIGMPAVLIFHTRETATDAGVVNQSIRRKYSRASIVMVANVVNLRGVPWLFRGIAESALRKAYQEVAAALPQGMSPEDYVVILPDWDSAVTEAVGLQDVDNAVGILVLDRAGNVVGVYQEDDPVSAALAMLIKAGA